MSENNDWTIDKQRHTNPLITTLLLKITTGGYHLLGVSTFVKNGLAQTKEATRTGKEKNLHEYLSRNSLNR